MIIACGSARLTPKEWEAGLTAVLLIRVVPTIIDSVTDFARVDTGASPACEHVLTGALWNTKLSSNRPYRSGRQIHRLYVVRTTIKLI